ncbi:MAG: hypothetical protein KDC24_02820 [Saprospiraceae bacterium]|nr:hypothetical protein [Saprospiraceae bacterium]
MYRSSRLLITGILGLAFLFSSQSLFAVHPPWGIATDIEGNIYFPDLTHHSRGALWKIDKKGKLILLEEDFHAHNVVTDKFGNVYSSHGEADQYFIRFSPKGKKDTLVHKDNFNDFFGGNCTITKDGKIVFGIENKIWTLDNQGNRVPYTDFEFSWNQALFADEEGNLFATDIKRHNGSIVKIPKNGKPEIVAENLISSKPEERNLHNDVLLGMGKDEAGELYVAETAGKQILKVKAGEKPSTFYKSEDEWTPTAITFRDGVAYILESHESNAKGPKITIIQNGKKPKTLFDFPNYFKDAWTQMQSQSYQLRNSFWVGMFLLPLLLASLIFMITKSIHRAGIY